MNTVVNIVRSWAASDSSVNPTKEILEWVEQRNATVKVRIDKTDFDQLIEKNKDKAKKKQEKRIKRMEKAGIDPKTINQYASMNTRNVQPSTKPVTAASTSSKKPAGSKAPMTAEEKEAAVKKATEMYNKNAPKPGSIAAKANMVKVYNENNNSRPEKDSTGKK